MQIRQNENAMENAKTREICHTFAAIYKYLNGIMLIVKPRWPSA